MKNKNYLIPILFLILASTIGSTITISAQGEGPSVFVSVDYMKSSPGEDYVKMENEIWKPMHQKAIKDGNKLAWNLYQVIYPGGTNSEYDYVTVNVYQGFDKLESNYSSADFQKAFKAVHPSKNFAESMEWTENSRDLVKSDLFVIIGEAVPGPPTKMSEYMVVNLMKTTQGNGEAYAKMEHEYYKPYHAALVEAGRMDDWTMLAKIFPRGADTEYSHVTVDFWGDWNKIDGGGIDNSSIWEKTHPGVKQSDIYPKMMKLRTILRSELWQTISTTRTE